ncbi:MAG: carboxypeptidase-like regulatory domain-containing protein [Actinomycetota bacterium]
MRPVLAAPVVALLLGFTLSGCASGSSTSDVRQGIRGTVVAGPQCPVESARSPCPPKPLPSVEVEVTNGGGVVAKTTTDEHGAFVVTLDPGTYAVQAAPGQNGFMSSRPVPFEVRVGTFTRVTVPVDTGIR